MPTLDINRVQGNQWNDLLNGAIQGTASLVTGLNANADDKRNKQEAESLYGEIVNKYSDYTSLLDNNKTILDGYAQQLNPPEQQTADQTNIISNPAQVEQPKELSQQELMKQWQKVELLKGKLGMNPYGKNYDTKDFDRPEQKKTKYKIEKLDDGSFIGIDEDNPKKFIKLPYQNEGKKKDPTVNDVNNMSIETMKAMPVDELDKLIAKSFDYITPEKRQEIFDNFDQIKKQYDDKYNIGEFTKQTGSNRSRGGSRSDPYKNSPEMKKIEGTIKELYDKGDKGAFEEGVSDFAEKMNLTIDEARDLITKSYKGGDISGEIKEAKELRSENEQYLNDLTAFQNDLENNVYGYIDEATGQKVPNFKISGADWFRELREGGYLNEVTDGQWRILKNFFKRKTNEDLESYTK